VTGSAFKALEFSTFPACSPIGEPWPLWVLAGSGSRLHVAVRLEELDHFDDGVWWGSGKGATLCGYEGHLAYPGVASRLTLPRCAWCCRRIGIPRGVGHPKNDRELRVLFGYPETAPAGTSPGSVAHSKVHQPN
jgi:hypothetical protein